MAPVEDLQPRDYQRQAVAAAVSTAAMRLPAVAAALAGLWPRTPPALQVAPCPEAVVLAARRIAAAAAAEELRPTGCPEQAAPAFHATTAMPVAIVGGSDGRARHSWTGRYARQRLSQSRRGLLLLRSCGGNAWSRPLRPFFPPRRSWLRGRSLRALGEWRRRSAAAGAPSLAVRVGPAVARALGLKPLAPVGSGAWLGGRPLCDRRRQRRAKRRLGVTAAGWVSRRAAPGVPAQGTSLTPAASSAYVHCAL